MSAGRKPGFNWLILPPMPIVGKFILFASSEYSRIGLISAPNSMVCLPLDQESCSRTSGTATLRAWELKFPKGLDRSWFCPKPKRVGAVGANSEGKSNTLRVKPAKILLTRVLDIVQVWPTTNERL